MLRSSFRHVGAVVTLIAACHHAPGTGSAPAAPTPAAPAPAPNASTPNAALLDLLNDVGRAVGDTASAPRLVGIDHDALQLTFTTRRPAYLALLAVRPGGAVVPLWVADEVTPAGRHAHSVDPDPAASGRAREAAAARDAAVRACARSAQSAPAADSAAATRRCEAEHPRPRAAMSASTIVARYGYVFLVASPTPFENLPGRLVQITATGDGLPATMTAIGDAVAAARWSGSYAKW